MEPNEVQIVQFEMEDENGDLVLKGEIKGLSKIQFYDDIKLRAVIALLNAVDQENFKVTENLNLFYQLIEEIEGTINEIKEKDRFQGAIK